MLLFHFPLNNLCLNVIPSKIEGSNLRGNCYTTSKLNNTLPQVVHNHGIYHNAKSKLGRHVLAKNWPCCLWSDHWFWGELWEFLDCFYLKIHCTHKPCQVIL